MLFIIEPDQSFSALNTDLFGARTVPTTIQPVKEIGELTQEMGVFFHTDAAQAVGHIPVNVNDLIKLTILLYH